MRTKFSTVNDDDQSHHHSGINKIVKIYLFTQNTEQVIVHSHTHLIQTLSKILLEVKKPKNTCTAQQNPPTLTHTQFKNTHQS